MTGFSLDHLTIEVTESALMYDMERACSTALALKAIGCRLALDDFGTGTPASRICRRSHLTN